MRPRLVIAADKVAEHVPPVAFVHDDHMVEALPAQRADEPLGDAVCLRCRERREHGLDADLPSAGEWSAWRGGDLRIQCGTSGGIGGERARHGPIIPREIDVAAIAVDEAADGDEAGIVRVEFDGATGVGEGFVEVAEEKMSGGAVHVGSG